MFFLSKRFTFVLKLKRISTNKQKPKNNEQKKLLSFYYQLSVHAGINTNYYAKIERSELKPSIETLEKIIKALGINSSEIFPF